MAEKKKTVFTRPTFLPPDSLTNLERSRESLAVALAATDDAARFVAAHLSALRSAAALVAAAPAPIPVRGRRTVPLRSAWIRIAEADSDLAEWGSYFAAGASKRAAAEAGSTTAVSERESLDLLRAADRFLAVIETMLGEIPHRLYTDPADGETKASA